jgi:hypothetical protein
MSLLDTRAPAAQFDRIGKRVGGRVIADSVEVQQRDYDTDALMFWDDGQPRMQLVVEVEAGEPHPDIDGHDGNRTFYIKGQMLAAVKAAIRKSGTKPKAIPAGAYLYVTWESEEKSTAKGKRGAQPKKIYVAEYTAPMKPAAGRSTLDDGPGGLDDEPPF